MKKTVLKTHFRLWGRSPPGPDCKFTLVALHVLRNSHVTGLNKRSYFWENCLKLSHHHLHFILIFGFSIRVFNLLWENHVKLEQKHPPFTALPDKLLWIPDVESVLEDDVTEEVYTDITAVKHREMKCVVSLEHWGDDWFSENTIFYNKTKYMLLYSSKKCFTFLGTERHTSRPSLISPTSLSVEQDKRSLRRSWYLVILKKKV